MSLRYPYLGYGLGLRSDHLESIVSTLPQQVDWFEAVTENYLVPGGNPLYYLEQIREHYPVVFHGVTLSIGSTDPLNQGYIKQIKRLADRIKPVWISDHLCWSGCDGVILHDLLPLPQTEAVINHVVARVKQVQDILGQRFVLENISTYGDYKSSQMPEWEFVSRIAEEADCLILLDINNIYVNSVNHGFDPHDYLANIPVERVQQFHLAGHINRGTHIIDTHDSPIINSVWSLYQTAVARFSTSNLGPVSTMIERDDNLPPLEELITELEYAKKLAAEVADEKELEAVV